MIRCWLFGHNYHLVHKFRCFLLNNFNNTIGITTSHAGYQCSHCSKRHVVELEPADDVLRSAKLWESYLPYDNSFQREIQEWVDSTCIRTENTLSDNVETEITVRQGLSLVVDK